MSRENPFDNKDRPEQYEIKKMAVPEEDAAKLREIYIKAGIPEKEVDEKMARINIIKEEAEQERYKATIPDDDKAYWRKTLEEANWPKEQIDAFLSEATEETGNSGKSRIIPIE